jgi:predicted GNAT family acetyltransferase
MRSRTARFEFLEGFAPELAQSLRTAGFVEELRTPLMVCAPAGLRSPAAVPGLVIEMLTEESRIEDVQDSLTIPRRAFGSGNEEPASPEDAEDARVRFKASRRLLGRLHGEPVAVATAVAPFGGLSEIAGVAVLTEVRSRGIGAAMTAAATEASFAAGAELAFLTPGDTGAMRIYERAGFQPHETMIFAVDPE